MSIRSIRGAKARRFTAEESRRTSSIRGLRRVGVIAALGLATAISVAPSDGAAQGRPSTQASSGLASLGLARQLASCHAPTIHRPTVVLVHGAWAGTSSWDGELQKLQAAGYTVRVIGNPLLGLRTDAATVRDFLKTISGPIVLIGHSYGGSVITNAAAGLPNVKALVYVDAAAPAVGETTGQLSGSTSALNGSPSALFDMVPYPGAPSGATDLYLKKYIFVHDFANDLPRQTALRLWASQRAASTLAFSKPTRVAAWKTIPSWYFISTGDKIITPASELSMAQRAHSKITIFQGGSHVTLISHPAAVTRVIGSAICSVR